MSSKSENPVYDDEKTIESHLECRSNDHARLDDCAHGGVHSMSAEEKAIALRLANITDPGLRPFSYRAVVFNLMVLCVCLCSGDNGFDGTIMSSINSMKQFQAYFGLPAGGNSKTGIVFGIYTIGQISAFIPISILPDRVGRRWSMFLGNCCLLTGALISANAKNNGMFIGGRYLTGLGCTTAATSAKVYLAEITSPVNRGRYMGLLNSFYYVGQILASGVAIPFGRHSSDYAWRAPMYLQGAPALLNILFVFLLPESPRWLYARGHNEKAVEVLARLHSRNNDIDSPLIQLEIQEIQEGISLTGADRRFWDFRALFKTASARYRFVLCAIVAVWGQLSGNGLITYFLPILLGQAGITSPDRQRVLNFVNSVTSFVGALSGSAIVDHVGRRKLMLFSAFACCIGMGIVGGLLSPSGPQTSTRATAGISFIFLFMVFFSFGWTPLQALYPSEVLSYENRAKGLALQGICANTVSLINTFGLPVALPVLKWKTYLIFMAWDVVGICVIYYFVVETKQLSLEDMDSVFDSANPKDKSFELSRQFKERARAEKQQSQA